MKRMNLVIGLLLLLIMGGCMRGGGQKVEKPNVLIIFPDQLRRYSAGYWLEEPFRSYVIGKPDPVVTPAIDELARNGVVFTNSISNYPLCSPYRGMMLTGQYPERNGIWGNCRKGRSHDLRDDVKTITDYFYESGYNTAYFGKCHWEKTEPLFDENGNFTGTTDPPGGFYVNDYDTYVPPGPARHQIEYFYQALKNSHFDPRIYSNDPLVIDGKKDGELHRIYTFSPKNEAELIVKYLRNTHNQRDPDKPFCMIWSLNPPHNPWNDANTDMEMLHALYDTNNFSTIDEMVLRDNADLEVARYARHYFANVSSVDQYVGQVLDELEAQGILDNTIVLFTADHGEMLGSHGRTGKNVFETEAIATPLIIHYPEKLKPAVQTEIFGAIDVLPTIMGLAGMKESISEEIQGMDFSGRLLDDSSDAGEKKAALLMLGDQRGIYTVDYTFAIAEDPEINKITEVYLYDNIADPYQVRRLSAEDRPEVVEKMLDMLGRKLMEAGDPWYEQNKYSDFIVYPE